MLPPMRTAGRRPKRARKKGLQSEPEAEKKPRQVGMVNNQGGRVLAQWLVGSKAFRYDFGLGLAMATARLGVR